MKIPEIAIIEFPTLGPSAREEVVSARNAGFTSIAVHDWLAPAGRSLEELDDAVREVGFTYAVSWPNTTCILPMANAEGGTDIAQRTRDMYESLVRFSELGIPGMAIFTGPAGDRSMDESRAIVVSELRELGQAAGELGMFIAFEPMHSSLQKTHSFLSGTPASVSIIDEVGLDNVKITLDIWHYAESTDPHADVRMMAPHLANIHLCDYRHPTRGWADRALLGEGVAPVVDFVRALAEVDFQGYWEVEILSDNGLFGTRHDDSLWDRPTPQLLDDAMAAIEKTWIRAFGGV